MGKATRWFKVLLQGIKGSDSTRSSDSTPPPKEKRRWSFVKSYREKSSSNPNSRHSSDAANLPSIPRIQSPAVSGYVADDPNDASKHAIVVAAASAAAAEAAVAAAQAAAAVVRLTSSGRRTNPPSSHLTTVSGRDKRAAIVIQSHFRGYLARRALKALKGLVKLQALVRGHIMRKKTAETMRGIQAMLRAQARARAVRAYDSPSSSGKSSHIHHPGPPTPEKFELTSHIRNTKSNESTMLKGNGTRSSHRVLIHPDKGYVNSTRSGPQLGESMYGTVGRHANHMEDYYSRPDKILEIDTGGKTCRPQFFPKHGKSPFQFGSDQLTHSFTTTSKDSSPISGEIQSGLKPNTFRKLSVQEDEDEEEEDDGAFCTAENSPQLYSRRRRGGGTHTPTKSDASATSCFSGYSDCPSYMSYTESSIAKVRSLSAPKQRPPQQQQRYERASSTKRWSVHQQRHASFASKAYPGSGHLDRLGMPVRNDNAVVYYSGYLN